MHLSVIRPPMRITQNVSNVNQTVTVLSVQLKLHAILMDSSVMNAKKIVIAVELINAMREPVLNA